MILFIELAYLASSVFFILGIRKLSSPKTARQGNRFAATGMFLAVAATLLHHEVLTYEWILIGAVIGSLIGVFMALKTSITDMPQMVGLLNGFGGAASTLVALSEFYKISPFIPVDTGIAITLSLFIGGVTFTGSMIAFGKLQGIVTGKVVKYPGQHPINLILIIVILTAGGYLVANPGSSDVVLIITAVALVLGVLIVLPIGGADMPVAVSLLNSYSGLAAATTGFVLKNNELIIAGALVGASGIILTNIMCKGMNRSLMNVLLGGWSNAGDTTAVSTDTKNVIIKSVDSEEAAMLFDAAQNIIIIPGYGMAVAQAQHAVRDLVNLLEKKGKQVRFAIHPVAGRMPGHMNVLLAEANISYDKLFSMEEINDDFSAADISLVLGANDVVNPAARHDESSPIYGMPILNADYAKTVIVNKRTMNPGYAGIDNELFGFPNTLMYFGDAKDAINKLTQEIKNL